MYTLPLYTVLCVLFPYSFFFFHHRGRSLWNLAKIENGKWKRGMKMRGNIFLGPQSLVLWKRNSSALSVESKIITELQLSDSFMSYHYSPFF
jgi:hypothetical protein